MAFAELEPFYETEYLEELMDELRPTLEFRDGSGPEEIYILDEYGTHDTFFGVPYIEIEKEDQGVIEIIPISKDEFGEVECDDSCMTVDPATYISTFDLSILCILSCQPEGLQLEASSYENQTFSVSWQGIFVAEWFFFSENYPDF